MYDMMMMMIEESRVEMKADDHDHDHNMPENMVNWVPTRNKKELEEIKVWKNFQKQHPWSVSDPGLLSSILPEQHDHTPREYLSSPLLKGGFEVDKHPLLNKGDFLQINLGEEKNGILKIVGSKTLLNKNFLKWMFILLNIFAEICQATFGQEKSEGKMGRQKYLKLSIITSSVCLTMAIFEALHERNINGMVWQKRGYCCWFYYPDNQGRLFGKFSIYFGIISSIIQLIINLIEKITRKDIVKFEYMSLLLSIFYLVAAIIGSNDKKSLENVSIRCNVHGLSEIKGIIVEGCENKVFQCPHCELEDSNV